MTGSLPYFFFDLAVVFLLFEEAVALVAGLAFVVAGFFPFGDDVALAAGLAGAFFAEPARLRV